MPSSLCRLVDGLVYFVCNVRRLRCSPKSLKSLTFALWSFWKAGILSAPPQIRQPYVILNINALSAYHVVNVS